MPIFLYEKQMNDTSADHLYDNRSLNKFVQFAKSPIIETESSARPLVRKPATTSMLIGVQQYQKLRKTVLIMKVNRLRDIFIRKLKQNIHFNYQGFVAKQIEEPETQKIKIQGIHFPQPIQHLIIVLNFLSIVILVFLTSFSATLFQFSELYSTFPAVIAIKCVILAIMVLHFVANATGQNFKHGKQLRYLPEIASWYFLSLKAVIEITNIVNMILFIVFPKTMWLNGVFFGILCLCFLNYGSQLIYLQAAYIHTRRISLLWQLIKILVFNLLMTHLVATVLLAISSIETENSWVTKYGIQQQDWYVYYIAAYYWGTIIITTIGFGDISAGNYREQLVVSFLGMFSCIILGFNISEFHHIFGSFRESYRQVTKNKVTFERMIIRDQNNNARIDPILKRQIYRCIDDKSIDKGDIQFMDRKKFLQSLPEYLRTAYLKTSNRRIFSSVLFLNQLKHQTISKLAESFNNHYLYPEQANEDFRNYINILEEGQIGLTYFRKGATVNGSIYDSVKVGKKQSLMLLTSDFINMRKVSNFNLITKTYSTVWSLRVDNFVEILKQQQGDYEYYFSVLHQDNFDEDRFQTIICPRCSTSTYISRHSVYSCPQLSYIPMRNMTLYRLLSANKHQKQDQQKFKRHKDALFKISVLKYYKNYLKVFSNQLNNILSQQKNASLLNISNTRHSSIYLSQLFSIRSKQKKQEQYETQKNKQIEFERVQNYSHYFPNYNVSNITSTPMKKTSQRMANVASRFRKANSSRQLSVTTY